MDLKITRVRSYLQGYHPPQTAIHMSKVATIRCIAQPTFSIFAGQDEPSKVLQLKLVDYKGSSSAFPRTCIRKPMIVTTTCQFDETTSSQMRRIKKSCAVNVGDKQQNLLAEDNNNAIVLQYLYRNNNTIYILPRMLEVEKKKLNQVHKR